MRRIRKNKSGYYSTKKLRIKSIPWLLPPLPEKTKGNDESSQPNPSSTDSIQKEDDGENHSNSTQTTDCAIDVEPRCDKDGAAKV